LLSKRSRLRSSREIKETLKVREYESRGPLLHYVARQNTLNYSRLAVVTPKKLGKAVTRNRLRRVFKAAFAKIWRNMAKNRDLIVFPRVKAIGQPTDKVTQALIKQLGRLLYSDHKNS
jgi:ribonuclease P protein component